MKLLLLLPLVAAAFALTAMAADSAASKKGPLRHLVAFKFKETATAADIKKINDEFRALKGKISQIVSFEMGVNNSPEGFNKGCTHGYILTFKSDKDRDAYLVHPDHKKFGELVGPVLADVFVIDFWAE